MRAKFFIAVLARCLCTVNHKVLFTKHISHTVDGVAGECVCVHTCMHILCSIYPSGGQTWRATAAVARIRYIIHSAIALAPAHTRSSNSFARARVCVSAFAHALRCPCVPVLDANAAVVFRRNANSGHHRHRDRAHVEAPPHTFHAMLASTSGTRAVSSLLKRQNRCGMAS